MSESNREKIVTGKYIDLGLLLQNNSEEKDPKISYNNQGHLVAKCSSSEKNYTIERWTDVFLIFMVIYGSAHLCKYPDLVNDMHNVRLGAAKFSRGLGWKNYDQQFRLKMSMNPSLSWAIVDNEL